MLYSDENQPVVKAIRFYKESGNKAFAAGKYREAKLLYEVCISQSCDNDLADLGNEETKMIVAQAYSNMSNTLSNLGETKEALADAEIAVELAPTWHKVNKIFY